MNSINWTVSCKDIEKGGLSIAGVLLIPKIYALNWEMHFRLGRSREGDKNRGGRCCSDFYNFHSCVHVRG